VGRDSLAFPRADRRQSGLPVVTQHELSNTTVGVITAVAAAVPTIMKMANIFGEVEHPAGAV